MKQSEPLKKSFASQCTRSILSVVLRCLRAIFAPLAALPRFLNWGTHTKFVLRRYEVLDARIFDDVRIAIVSDLHGALYGDHQSDLVAALTQENPHVVLLLGDIFDQRGICAQAIDLVQQLASHFFCYFVPGNHEYKSGDIYAIYDILAQAKIPLLAGEQTILSVNNTKVQLFGIDDARGGDVRQLRQIVHAGKTRRRDLFSILAIHVPNKAESIVRYGFDLMLSGHTHGGQMAIPHLLNGLYAPGQGIFPKFGGGQYDFNHQSLIICRGLSQRPLWLPRLGNPPELCLVTLKPAK